MKTADIQVTLVDHMGTDLSVVNAARVSFEKEAEWEYWNSDGMQLAEHETRLNSEKKLSSKDAKLISYLAKHKHTSPFNHAFATFRVKAPLYVSRQLVKHKFMPINEVSRRYVDSEPEFYFPEYYRAKASNVKQGSSEEPAKYNILNAHRITEECLNEYNWRIAEGVCPEQARDCLPLNTMTEWIWSGSLGATADMCVLRLDSHAQYESRIVAKKISDEMAKLYPVSWAALMGDVLYGT